jgi:hypothetical protein
MGCNRAFMSPAARHHHASRQTDFQTQNRNPASVEGDSIFFPSHLSDHIPDHNRDSLSAGGG